MLNWFKKKDEGIKLFDLDDNPLNVGDHVESLRYDLGECELIMEEDQFFYRSINTDKKVSWLKMIDAATEKQKVRKILTPIS